MLVKIGPSWKWKAGRADRKWTPRGCPTAADRRELDALEAPADRPRQRFGEGRLAGAGIVLEQDWPPLANAASSRRIAPVLAAHDRLDVLRELAEDVLGLEAHAPTRALPPEAIDHVEDAKDLASVTNHLAIPGLAPAQHAVAVHDEGRAVGDVAIGVEDAVGADRGAVHVAQQRKREISRLHEGRVAERAVTADGDHRGASPRDLFGNPAQVAELRTFLDAPPVVAIEHEHHVLALEVGRDASPPALDGKVKLGAAWPKRRPVTRDLRGVRCRCG